MKYKNRSAFTLAEMMIVMLILTILLAAFAPLMTKKSKVDLSNPWRWAANNSDIYYGIGNTQTAMIGQNNKAATDPNTKLLINSGNNPALTVKSNNTLTTLLVSRDNTSMCFGGSSLCPTNNTSFGYNALTNETNKDTGNTAFGTSALSNNNGDGVADEGSNGSLEPFRNSSDGHLGAEFIGGRNNTAIGARALSNNITGHSNVAVSRDSLINNRSGTSNISIGAYSLKSAQDNIRSNVAIGTLALGSLTNGMDNIAIGSHAFTGNGYGGGALKSLATGNHNIAIGEKTFARLQNGNNNIAIGYGSCGGVTGSNKICIGANSGPDYYSTSSGENHMIWLGDSNVDSITVYIGSQTLNTIIAIASSDKRLKNISGESKYGLDVIRNLKAYKFTYKDDKDKTQHVGVIAQDLQKYIPESVKKDQKGYLSIYKEYIVYSMFNAIKELDKMLQDVITRVKTIATQVANHDTQIKALQQENKELKAKVQALEKQNKSFESRLKAVENKLK